MELRASAWLMEITAACIAIDSPIVKVDEGHYSPWVRAYAKVGPTDAHRRGAKQVAKAFQRRWAKLGLPWMARYNRPNGVIAQRYREWAEQSGKKLDVRLQAEYVRSAELAASGALVFRLE